MKRIVSNILFSVGAAVALVGLALLRMYFGGVDDTLSRIVTALTDTALCAVLIVFVYVFFSSILHKNFFLYDSKKRKNIPLSHLSYDSAADRLKDAFPSIFTERLFQEELPDELYPDAPQSLKPLLLPFAFCELAKTSPQSLLGAPKSTTARIAKSLEDIGETVFSKSLQNFSEENAEEFSKFYAKNADGITDALLRYIKEHIKSF